MMEMKLVLLTALPLQPYQRISHWEKCQKESGYSESAFCDQLIEVLKYYDQYIDSMTKQSNILGNQVTDSGIPLLLETNGMMTGHLYGSEIPGLAASIKQLMQSFGIYRFPTFAELYEDAKEVRPDLTIFLQGLHNSKFNEYISQRFGADRFKEDYVSFLTRKRFFEYLEYEKSQEKEEKIVTQKVNSKWSAVSDHGQSYVKPELFWMIEEVESRIPEKVSSWKAGDSKIECAAFCEMLFDRKYFIKPCTRIKTPTLFAMSRYGLHIEDQLKTAKESDRLIHKEKLKKFFKG